MRYRSLDEKLPYQARYTPVEIWREAKNDDSFIVIEDDGKLSWQYWERGRQGTTQETYDVDELLYFIFSERTFDIALNLELRTRESGDSNEEIYRRWNGFNLTLLESLSSAWAGRRKAEIEKIISESEPHDLSVSDSPIVPIPLPPNAAEISKERFT